MCKRKLRSRGDLPQVPRVLRQGRCLDVGLLAPQPPLFSAKLCHLEETGPSASQAAGPCCHPLREDQGCSLTATQQVTGRNARLNPNCMIRNVAINLLQGMQSPGVGILGPPDSGGSPRNHAAPSHGWVNSPRTVTSHRALNSAGPASLACSHGDLHESPLGAPGSSSERRAIVGPAS